MAVTSPQEMGSFYHYSHQHCAQLEEIIVLWIFNFNNSPGIQAASDFFPLHLNKLIGSNNSKGNASLVESEKTSYCFDFWLVSSCILLCLSFKENTKIQVTGKRGGKRNVDKHSTKILSHQKTNGSHSRQCHLSYEHL